MLKNIILACVLILCLIFLSVFLLTYTRGDSTNESSDINSFEQCAAAGNPIQESYPERCVTKDGKSFTNPAQQL